MKTKALLMLVIFSMILLNCIAQGLENKFGLGIFGPTSLANQIQSDQNRNRDNGAVHIFNSVYTPSAGIGNSTMPPKFVINEMTCTDEITQEQVGLIFNKAKEFPENTQISIAFIENGRIIFYGLKRQDNTIINIDNQSYVFETGSVTKVFTATLRANYVNDGTPDLEDHIHNTLESAGAVLSTTEDLAKFVIAQFDKLKRELALTRELTFPINEKKTIGLGWFISKTESGGILHRHKGFTGGYTSAMAIDIINETGIVILSNVSGFGKKAGNIDTLCFDLLTTIPKDNSSPTKCRK